MSFLNYDFVVYPVCFYCKGNSNDVYILSERGNSETEAFASSCVYNFEYLPNILNKSPVETEVNNS